MRFSWKMDAIFLLMFLYLVEVFLTGLASGNLEYLASEREEEYN